MAKSKADSKGKDAKERVLSVRLGAEQARELDALAEELGVPVSALVRDWITAGLAQHRTDSARDLFEFIVRDLQRLRALIH